MGEKKLKTLANCTSREFALQTAKLAQAIKKYSEKIKDYKEGLKKGESEEFANGLDFLTFICEGNIDETMELCGAFCFMSGEEFASLDPEKGDPDGIAAVVEVFNSKRCLNFLFTAKQIVELINEQ